MTHNFGGPAWLTARYEEACAVLDGAEAVALAAQAALAVEEQAGALAGGYMALSGAQGGQQPPAPVPGFDPWGHTLGRQRQHTLGYTLEHYPQTTSAPDVLAARKAEAEATPRRRAPVPATRFARSRYTVVRGRRRTR